MNMIHWFSNPEQNKNQSNFQQNEPGLGGGPMPKTPMRPHDRKPDSDRKRMILFMIVPLVFFMVLQIFVLPNFQFKDLSYSEFYDMIEQNPTDGYIRTAELVDNV